MSPPAPVRDRRPLLIVVVSLVLIATAWFFVQGPGTRILSPKGSTVAQFSGDGDQSTSTFSVRGSWQIKWSSSGGGFAMAIVGDRNFGTVIREDGAAEGLNTPTTGGAFHLEITAGGPWTVTVLQGD